MKIPDLFNGEKMIVQFVEEQITNSKTNYRSRLQPEILRDDFNLDFHDMLEREWTLQQEECFLLSHSHINTSKNIKNNEIREKGQFHTSVEIGNEKQQDNLRVKSMEKKMISLETVFDNPEPIYDIDLFLESPTFKNCIRFFVLMNLVGLILTDYSFRLQTQHLKFQQISIYNKISLNLQLLANCAFSLQIILKMFSKKKFFEDPWRILNLIGNIACWITIFMDFMYYDQQPIFQILICLKILLGIRVIELFDFIRIPFEDFITTIPDLGKIFFPLLIFIAFYSVLGLLLFAGANQYKCRETPFPVNQVWPETSPSLCGSANYECSVGYCGNPYDYGMPYNETQRCQYGNEFGLVSFDNIGSSILTTYHYVFLSNWTSIKYKFSRFITPYITTIYFLSLAIFLFFIMANLNMITICKAYIQKEKNREKMSEHHNDECLKKSKKVEEKRFSSLSKERSKATQILEYVQIAVIIINSILILIDYERINSDVRTTLNYMDFVLTLFSTVLVLLKLAIMRKMVISNSFNILDWFLLTLNILGITYAAINEGDPIQSSNQFVIILKTIKFVRIIRLIYFSENWFAYEKTILRMFGETIKTMRYFFLLLCCLVLVTAFLGQNLFAYKVRFASMSKEIDIENGVPYVSNYQSIYKSIVSVILMLENERWTETMYNYYKAVGWQAVIYFAIVVFVIHLMLMRLFIAIFLCYFRRNLQKSSSNSYQNLSHSGDSGFIPTMGNIKQTCILQYLQEKREQKNRNVHQTVDDPDRKNKETGSNSSNKLFFFFNRNLCIFQMLRAFYNSQVLKNTVIFLIGIHCLAIVVRSNEDSEEKTYILDSIEKAPLAGYCIEVVIGILGHGFFFGEKSYMKLSRMNYINLIVVIIVILSEFSVLGELEMRILKRFAIIKIFTPLARANKETSIILKSISNIAENFIRVFWIYIFLLLIPCLIPLKLENDELYDCKNFYSFSSNKPANYQDCMLAGGDWVKDPQSFTNVFSSLVLMYQIVTSESWTYYIERLNNARPWDIYFVINFFIYNTCLLNIFVGMTVETYLALKDEAYKLNLLRPNQRMWILIKNSINELVPVPAMREPETKSFVRKLAFRIISRSIYENFIDILAYVNLFVYTLRFYRADSEYLSDLYNINIFFTVIFCVDTVLKLQLGWDYFFLDGSKTELMGLVFFMIYGVIKLSVDLDHDSEKTLEFVGAMFLILRCKKLIFRYTWCKTLVNSVLDVLPKCIRIGQILAIVLFFYMAIGMELFKYTKPTAKIDGYTTGFNNALTSLMTLLKIVSNQSWFEQVSAYVRSSTPADVCFPISTISDAKLYANMGCGSYYAYFFFISFHVIMALLILNLLIATMTAAYDENYEKQYKSVNIFQLQDCLKLWQKYDPKGTAVIPYKKFWRLSSEIAILFGISKKKLIKSKQKFLEELDIEICQSTKPEHTSVLCYKFHDVIMKFSKIKLQVSKSQATEQSSELADFEIHPMIQAEIKDYITQTPPLYENYRPYKNFKSGEMKYFFGLLRKLRAWKLVAKKKDSSVISKLSQIIKVALQKRQKEEEEMGHIRSYFLGPT